MKVFIITVVIALLFIVGLSAQLSPRFYAVNVLVKTTESPPSIELDWSSDACTGTFNCTQWTVYRKVFNASLPHARDAGTSIVQIPVVFGAITYYRDYLPWNATKLVDTNVTVGTAYEYRVSVQTSVRVKYDS